MKIHCPFHEDVNPSMEVYPGGYGFCFVCWKRHKLDSIERIDETPKKEAEDIGLAVTKIRELPRKEIRGLELHTNGQGYFIVWPNLNYYKFRSFKAQPRYMAPRGHSQPLLKAFETNHHRGVLVVEGELNALSLRDWALRNEFSIVSPGPAGNFISMEQEIVDYCKDASSVIIWTDEDTAGIKALWSIYPKLLEGGPRGRTRQNLVVVNSKTDANEMLLKGGQAQIDEFLSWHLRRGK
jgi:hypothetical protein